MARPDSLSAAQARRVNIAAQGLAEPRPTGRIDRRHLRRIFDRLGLVQIDSVNVLVRSHYVPLFSRLGDYDRSLLDRFAYEDHEVFEYWGHEASLLRSDLHPLLRWRMAEQHRWGGMRRFVEEHGHRLAPLEAEIVERGPVSAGELESGEARKGPWWGWGPTKRAVEALFWTGAVSAVRRPSFERAYCDPALAVPAEHLAAPAVPEHEAKKELLLVAARGHGVGTAKDLADWFRLNVVESRRLLDELASEERLVPVTVEGWPAPAYLHPDARIPRRVSACALVSPFDSAMWERDRVERTYGFRYRIEIYVPRDQRRYGYYVLPFLLGDRYVARADLKADRAARTLLVQSAWAEDGIDELEVAEALSAELTLLASWLGLDDVVVKPHGDLAPVLGSVG